METYGILYKNKTKQKIKTEVNKYKIIDKHNGGKSHNMEI
jgi:hypothetical protein